MYSDDSVDVASVALLLRRRKRKRLTIQKRRFWVRPIFELRKNFGEFHRLIQELKSGDHEYFFRYFRMSVPRFEYLLNLLRPALEPLSSRRPGTISAEEKLAVTLRSSSARYLATGDSQQTISFSYRIGRSTVCSIVRTVCEAIWNVLQPIYLKPPSHAEWLAISRGFYNRWNMPNNVGSADGKHVVLQAPKNSGSAFFNYKFSHSIVLLAVCDENYCFTLVDIGAAGSQSDGGIFSNSSFGQALKSGSLNLPGEAPLPNSDILSPFFLVYDEAFPLLINGMRPYPGRKLGDKKEIFNYRLSRDRRTIENTFGILAAKWRIFRRPIIADVSNVDKIVKAAVCLHNYLKKTDAEESNSSYR